MFRTATAVFLTVGLLAAVAHATVIEIPLPGLLGLYPLDESHATRTVTVVLPQIPTVIHGASFRIAGTAVLGSADCDEFGDNAAWSMEFYAHMQAGTWIASPTPPGSPDGPFGWTAAFRPVPSTATWDFLMDGEGEIRLYGAPTFLLGLCHQPYVVPSGTVTEAVLIVDAEFPVSIEASTWGAIKALYRAP